MEKLRVGIIGCGGISHVHMKGYTSNSGLCEVVAACDIDAEKLKKYCEQYNIPHAYTDCAEMIKHEKLDCVSVCTWTAAHAPCAITALKGGVNVLCEKPMAMNAEQADEMIRARDESGKLLMIGFCRRFGEDAKVLADFTNKDTFGDIYYAKTTYLRRNGFPGGWFGTKEYSGGGPLIDLGVHVIDLVRYLSGLPKPVSAYGVTYNNLGVGRAKGEKAAWSSTDKGKYPYNVEDFCSAMVRFDNGMTLSVETSFNLNIRRDTGYIELFGTKAGAHIESEAEIYTDMNGYFVNLTPTRDLKMNFNQLFIDEIRNFLLSSDGKEKCISPAEDGKILMQIIDAIYRSAQSGKAEEIL